MKAILFLTSALLVLGACSGETPSEPEQASTTSEAPSTQAPEATQADQSSDAQQAASAKGLDEILAAQPENVQARYAARHPKDTLEFLGVEPGMRVVEVLPGGGWYTKILLPYLGEEGTVVGADYSPAMWALFGGFATPEFLEARKTWADTWTAQASDWRGEGDADIKAFAYGAMPADMAGTADMVLMVRAFHHFNRFEDEGQYLTTALAETFQVLKPGGVVGIVQHRAPEANDEAWANGDNGYVKESHVIATMQAAGFELVDQSEINANPADQPTNEDVVWRLPPTLATSADDEALKAKMIAIGESDRMTLKFRKPS